MTDREKLVELLSEVQYLGGLEEKIADHLIANGVTFGKDVDVPNKKKMVPLDDVYRLIAGHSEYYGGFILSALTCVAEGKEVKPVKPIERTESNGRPQPSNWKPKPQTNADRIRAMSDEELAVFLCGISATNCCGACMVADHCYTDHNGFSEWLRQPAEEGT